MNILIHSVHEWHKLKEVKCDTHIERFDLIMSRFTGKTLDVVKVSQHSCPELSVTVFETLKGNFAFPLNLPMKDYSIILYTNECAMDYLIHLNKSSDAADLCL